MGFELELGLWLWLWLWLGFRVGVGDEVGVGLPGGDLTVRIGCNDEAVVVEGPAVFIADLHWQPASIKA